MSSDTDFDFSDGWDYDSIPASLLDSKDKASKDHFDDDDYPDSIDYSLVPVHLLEDTSTKTAENRVTTPPTLTPVPLPLSPSVLKYFPDTDNFFDTALCDLENFRYANVPFKKLRAASWVCDEKIELSVFDSDPLTEDFANEIEDVLGGCLYCLAMKDSDLEIEHSSIKDCPGPMKKGAAATPYLSFQNAVPGHPLLCDTCSCPLNGIFNRANRHECSTCVDAFQGIPFLIWATSELKRMVFEVLGVSRLNEKLNSTVDFCQWMSQSSDDSRPELTNSLALIWAFTRLLKEGKLDGVRSSFGKPSFLYNLWI
jgi:hypothetical protein